MQAGKYLMCAADLLAQTKGTRPLLKRLSQLTLATSYTYVKVDALQRHQQQCALYVGLDARSSGQRHMQLLPVWCTSIASDDLAAAGIIPSRGKGHCLGFSAEMYAISHSFTSDPHLIGMCTRQIDSESVPKYYRGVLQHATGHAQLDVECVTGPNPEPQSCLHKL